MTPLCEGATAAKLPVLSRPQASACHTLGMLGAEEEEEEMRVRMRQAQRQMKGTKLQYLDQQPVLFSDCAGVPGAKVRPPARARLGATQPHTSHCRL